MRPLIKWTGGKYKEFALFAHHIPHFERYVEPFFGGGGVFFALQPRVPAFINDKSADLINFYRQLGQEDFKAELLKYADAWTALAKLSAQLWESCEEIFTRFIYTDLPITELHQWLEKRLTKQLDKHSLLNDKDFLVDAEGFRNTLLSSLTDKAKRIKRIEQREKRQFNASELAVHFETGLRSGTYLFFRKLLNQYYKQTLNLSMAKSVANWYFVRELCYGAMFRFNAKGEFNIPYGGIAYNKKNLHQKIQHIFSNEIAQLFEATKIANEDFEAFLNGLDLKPSDFIFLDPPYDSEFSEYDQNAFTQHDQERLANFLISCKAKWMVVIKETEFIRKIYTHPQIKIVNFNKSYSYNVRGRNQRAVVHLIITNY
ncbi:DNA adenine methylase [Pedobacter sp. KR3-3]|uniref:site-specific DNA-methyltransferase (adenine-specific) n=1 Tax=Pedobacter albus TaxID=3113905 RepID=A0ABU7I3T8_9SPHI|nr:DNA adenine methylase [Pedobacter sp. KR3-3]MEE1944127.1 DNA adenine methylase [Pedobacter sp. KR3-3]